MEPQAVLFWQVSVEGDGPSSSKKCLLDTLKKMIFALCSISLIKMSSCNITLGKNGPNLILLNLNNVI